MNYRSGNDENKSYHNYCLKYGNCLNDFKNPYLIKDGGCKTCSMCNTQNKDYHIYCIKCGNELYKLNK